MKINEIKIDGVHMVPMDCESSDASILEKEILARTRIIHKEIVEHFHDLINIPVSTEHDKLLIECHNLLGTFFFNILGPTLSSILKEDDLQKGIQVIEAACKMLKVFFVELQKGTKGKL